MRQEGKLFGAFVIGGLIGASVALLYAPKSGEETRRNIKRRAKELKKKAVRAAEDLYEEIEELSETLRRRIDEMKQRGEELSEDAKREILEQIDRISKAIDDKKRRLMEIFD